ncbi:MAG: type II toxin-antitoxin system death-on-curing family toxin [Pyrinomonadaceae bacterium]|mgnify:CR=1 FL=1|jgi:death-on-curing protein|nr:type II toxin-antitoxin system death-on-curing family toxin [Blastocatellia bacterium]MCW5955094.1 type II toxin-antitoxin system death-on-curing family toxin [Pyrinomonadaceae bacterium]
MKWLRTDAVLAMHKRQIAEHGGGDEVRDLGLLKSALADPQNIAAYERDADIARLAAAYAFGIAKDHQFGDGNNRTSLIACRTFLILNGYQLDASPTEKYLTFLSLGERALSEEELAERLRDKVVEMG